MSEEVMAHGCVIYVSNEEPRTMEEGSLPSADALLSLFLVDKKKGKLFAHPHTLSIRFLLISAPCRNISQSSTFCAIVACIQSHNDGTKCTALQSVEARRGVEYEADGETH